MICRIIRCGFFAALLSLGVVSLTLAEDPAKKPAGPIPITVSVIPQQWLVDAIGGNYVETTVMVKPGASPAVYEPTPSQMRSLSETEVYFAIGVPFEHAWLPRFIGAVPELKVVNMAERVKRRTMDDGNAPSERNNAHHHPAGDLDPHVWVSPPAMRIMASSVVEVLSRLRLDLADDFRHNYANVIKTINTVDIQVAHELADVSQRTFMVFHPAWGYFADAYGLRQMAIEIGGKDPSPQDMHKIVDAARANDIKVIFVQAQFSQRAARAIAGNIGGEVKPLDPLAYDWPANMRAIAAAFAATLH